MPSARLYVGNLPKDRAVERHELEEAFDKFGRVVDIWVARQPPGFAFVTMEEEKDAEEAVKEMDGAKLAGERIKVEVSKGGEVRRGPRDEGGRGGRSRSRGGGGGRSRSRGRGGDRRGGGGKSKRRRSPSYSDYSESESRSRSPKKSKRKRR
mmetsp:Transcript_44254/g.71642  ORF Transcript_44254/g.71642 Transcript_44254/m.71642 type:complete len:152 (-) Transcript_44254:127-582(-)